MGRLWGDFDRIESDFEKLTEEVNDCMSCSFQAMLAYIEEGETDRVRELNKNVHTSESQADSIRREILNNIIEGSLMPSTRVDMLNLLEAIDDIADHTEDMLDEIIFLHLDFCCLDEKKLEEMTDLIEEQYSKMAKGIEVLFEDMNQSLVYAGELEELESKVDGIEEEITRSVGRLDHISPGKKLAHRSLIKNVSDTADLIEDVGDNMETIVSVRKG
ncbi:DUF47 domain-containing protein [Halarsenatibacter silvermanii]|uniref:TIGR00153 family protein n=1 Tax=Halarsenatibacter silvermanii TaxID=321763 RepID=A0A1G9N1H9_9FIRM|nr:DUF47 family protein [Halarsenatibacter silvermanii]SDL80358.1 TIGR00153 family protein [Halarsenatibacter silvermanii]